MKPRFGSTARFPGFIFRDDLIELCSILSIKSETSSRRSSAAPEVRDQRLKRIRA